MWVMCDLEEKFCAQASWRDKKQRHRKGIHKNISQFNEILHQQKKLRHRKGIHKNISQFNEIPHQQFTRFDQIWRATLAKENIYEPQTEN